MTIKTVDEGRRHRRELWIDEETQVAHLWVIDYVMRIGTAEVKMAGIGGVHTEREHRMKGYMRVLFQDTVDYMTEQGHDVTMLFGIPAFYDKFGYATCMGNYRVNVATRDAEDAAAEAGAEMRALTPRPVTPDDMPGIVACYTAENATRTGPVLRDPADFTTFPHGTNWGTPTEAVLWEDETGDLLGYLVCDRSKTAVTVAEVGTSDPALYPTILTYLAKQAIEKRCEHIGAILPTDHAFAEYLQRFGSEWEIAYPRYGDGMLRILNQPELFEKLAPELARRIAGMAEARPIALETDLGAVTLIPEANGLRCTPGIGAEARLTLSQDKLTQLVMGYRSIRDVLNSSEVTMTGDALSTLAALFPKDVAFVWSADHF
jgi:predicted acetyltransferase